MPRVLVISYYFPPMGGVEVKRVTRFVRHLPEFGWDPIVVTSKGGHWNAFDESLLTELPEGLDIIRFRAINHPSVVHRSRLLEEEGVNAWQEFRRSRKLLDRFRRRLETYDEKHLCFPDDKNWWAANVQWHFRSLIRKFKPDVIWATGPPWSNLVLSHWLSRKTGIPAIADIRDPWSWHPQRLWAGARQQPLEREVLAGHAHVVTVTEGFRNRYAQLYPELSNRLHLIRNGFEDSDFGKPKSRIHAATFCYVGSLTAGNLKDVRKRTLYLFLKALGTLRDKQEPGIEGIRIKVAGRNVNASQALVDEMGLNDRVCILGALPTSEARKLREEADVLILIDMLYENRDSTFIALKVYEYLAANRPILALLPEGSEAGEIIRKAKRGVVCRVDDVEDIANGIRRLLTNAFEYDPTSDVSEYSVLNTTRQLAEILDAIAGEPRQSEKQ
jgi:glycosyltransferase involved in cell wall biosynthesis